MALLGLLRGGWSTGTRSAACARLFLMQRTPAPALQERTVALFSPVQGLCQTRSLVSGFQRPLEGGVFGRSLAAQVLPWRTQQVRTRARGNEYQPNNKKRIRTHGWLKRLSTRGGIEVILRRMLKGRKSLSH